MIGGHPGGARLTGRLLALARADGPSGAGAKVRSGMPPAASPGRKEAERALDLGAGTGESVRCLRALGYDAVGIDLDAGGDGGGASADGTAFVIRGDMTALPFADGSFDLCLAECSVSVCGDGPAALGEAYRVLRPGGSLLLSDVFFHKEDAPHLSMPAPLTCSCWEQELRRVGFAVRRSSDETALWREFFLEWLWADSPDPAGCDFYREAGKAGCGYFLAWLQKADARGGGGGKDAG